MPMKNNVLYVLFLTIIVQCTFVNAQLGIGVEVNSAGRILDFEKSLTNTKGIILPIVENPPFVGDIENGTFLFDASEMQVKVKEDNLWKKLTFNRGDLSLHKPNLGDEVGGGVYLGDQVVNGPKGVLVLNAVDKALVLPHVFKPHENVKEPYPGMICFDTDSKSLFVFNGKYWSVWRKSSNR